MAGRPPSASRPAAAVIAPIVHQGVRYESRWSDKETIFAVDEKTGKQRWKVKLYEYRVDPAVETDVQEVFLRSMVLSGDGKALEISDERGGRYLLDLETRKVRRLEWPVSLELVEAKPTPKGWRYSVKLSIDNSYTRKLKLDGPSVAEGGEVRNNLFEVKVDGKAVDYRGEMAKRAPPDRFIELAPGTSYSAVVELGETYPVPAGQHRVEIRFAHRNHFSPDDFELVSLPIVVAFDKEGGHALTPPPKPRAP